MHILVNALSARRGGSLVFAVNLLPALASIDPTITYHVLAPASLLSQAELNKCKNVVIEPTSAAYSPWSRLYQEHVTIPQMLSKRDFVWYFQIDDDVPPLAYITGVKTLAVFHASIQFLLPDALGDSKLRIAYWRTLKAIALRQTTTPVTMSFCAKGELSQGKSSVFKKLQVIYPGIDHKLFSTNATQSANIPELLKAPYILSVSTRNPHKNYFRLVQAYELLVRSHQVDEHLVLVGSSVWRSEEDRIKTYVEQHGLTQRVHLLSAMDNCNLPGVYQRASAYVYPSLFDSFGFTPLEAMACGVPCAVSRFSALPEVCGDAAQYFDPLDVQDIAESMFRVLQDQELRTNLTSKGKTRVQGFTWDHCAQAYFQLLTNSGQKLWST